MTYAISCLARPVSRNARQKIVTKRKRRIPAGEVTHQQQAFLHALDARDVLEGTLRLLPANAGKVCGMEVLVITPIR
jgi:hypothetical protein